LQGVDATEPLGPAKQFAGTVSSPGNGWSLRAAARGRREEPSDALAGSSFRRVSQRSEGRGAGCKASSWDVTVERLRREAEGVERHTARMRCSAEKRRSRRETVAGTLRATPSHTVERGADWLRSEDLAMSGVRELRLCSRKETRLRSRANLEGAYRTDQQSCTKGIHWERATSSRECLVASGHGIGSHGTAGMRRAGDSDLTARAKRSSEDLRTGWNVWVGVKARVRAVSFGRSWETRHGALVDGEEEMPRTARMIGCNDAS